MSELNLLIVASISFVGCMHFPWQSSAKKTTISLRLWAAKEIYYLDGWGLPRNVYYLVVQGCQGISITWWVRAVKEYLLLAGWYLTRKFIYLTVKLTFPCQLCKLYSGPPDQHPRGGAWEVGGGICKSVITQSKGRRRFANPPFQLPCTPILGCWSGGSDWSLHSLHGGVGLHLIRCLRV